MSSKTKIVVLHVKEIIYTGIFILLGILFIGLLLIMFLPNEEKEPEPTVASATYIPGVYTTSLVLNDNTIDIEVVVDADNINSIRLVNLDETITTMYPLIEPSFTDIIEQVYQDQSLDNVTYSDDSKYTSMVLLDAISNTLDKANVIAE